MQNFWSPLVERLSPYVPGEQSQDRQYIKLNTNENPYPPSPKVLHVMQEGVNESLRLYPDPTANELKQAIAAQMDVDVSQVFVGNGSDEVLAFAFMAFFTEKGAIQYPDISYSFYPAYCDLLSIDVNKVPLADDFSIRLLDYDSQAPGIIFPNPNAPTGCLLPLTEIEALLKRNAKTLIIVDEAYIDFGGESATALINDYENLLVIQTFSKSRSLAGMRIGYALGNPNLIDALVRVKDSFNSYPLDKMAQLAGIAAMQDNDYFVEMTNNVITTRENTSKALNDLGFEVLPSAANFVFAKHPDFRADELYQLLKEQGVLVRYFNKPRIDAYLRISIGTNEEMQRLLDELSKILKR